MTISTEYKKKIKSLHALSKLPFGIYDLEGKCYKTYTSTTDQLLPRELELDILYDDFSVYYGNTNELFFLMNLKDFIILIGPLVSESIQLETDKIKKDINYLDTSNVFSISQFRELLVLIDSLFDANFENKYSKYLHDIVEANKQKLSSDKSFKKEENFKNISYSYIYEQRLLSIVATGKVHLLKDLIFDIGLSVPSFSTGNSLRSEKDYSIILMEKISNFVIQLGVDICESIRIRNLYINEIEKCDNTLEVLSIRHSGVMHFIELINCAINCSYTLFIKQVIQYIHLHIYENIKISDIEKYFYVSSTNLRRRFKSETGKSIKSYILDEKIKVAKYLLLENIPPGEVSRQLNFYDTAHFSNSFKKSVGITPLQFQKKNSLIANFNDTNV